MSLTVSGPKAGAANHPRKYPVMPITTTPMSTATHLFESGLAMTPATACLDTLIRQHLELAANDMIQKGKGRATPPSPPSEPSSPSNAGALVNEMGDYLARTAMLWSHLTENLTKGPHIDRAALQVHEQSRADTKLSDLSAVAAMDVSIGRLRKIRDLTAQFSRDVQAIWRSEGRLMMDSAPVIKTAISPYYEVTSASQSMSGMGDGDSRVHKARKLLPDNVTAPRGGDASGSDDSEDDSDDDDQFANIDMDALRQRGKGTYYCPKGLRCDKGGVDKDGNLILFDRNSSFAQHCNKHRKPWRCDIPGCPNPPKKRKFARRDGLERHKATVKHFT